MALEKYISEIKTVDYPQETVFNRLSNLKNLEQFFDPEKLAAVKEKVPNAPDINIEEFRATEDECSFKISPLGLIGVRVIEREPFKTIKIEGNEAVPFSVNFWIQLLPSGEESCKIRLTLHADLSPMIKMMVSKHLEEGINRIADALTKIPFN
jgi:carbon monoxide dehydrogenase subunit G